MVKLRKKAAKGDAVAGSSSGAKVRGWGGARGCAVPKGYGLESVAGWWACSLAATSQTTAQMHGHHEATMGLAGVSLGRELRALALSHTTSVQRGTGAPPENSVTNSRADCALTQPIAVWLRARALSSRPKLTPASPIVVA